MIQGYTGGRCCFYVTPFTSDAKIDPPALGNEYLTPLAINAPYRQISYDKTLVDVLLAPCWSAKVIWSLPPVLKGLI